MWAFTVNIPYFHVLFGLGFSFLQLGHVPIMINCFIFAGLNLKDFNRGGGSKTMF